MHWDIVGIALIDAGANIGPDKKALVKKDTLPLRISIGSRAFRMEMMKVQIGDIAGLGPTLQRLNQHLGHTGYATEMDMAVAAHDGDGFISRYIVGMFAHIEMMAARELFWFWLQRYKQMHTLQNFEPK